MFRSLAPLVFLVLAVACAGPSAPPAEPAAEAPAAVRAPVTDLDAFAAFIATQPSPADFRAKYPGVTLVLPGDISTKEFRTDNSRYFAELDANGRITGGRFM